MQVSVVVPIYNELENVERLYRELGAVLSSLGRDSEIVLVDDGSTDGTTEKIRELAARDPQVKAILFRRNYGQTAAMQAGLQNATGEYIVTMDGDLQNDPRDIPMMLEKLDEGFDLVHGWRKKRQDAWLNRRLPSIIANWIISKTTGFPIHDLGCTLKAIRSDIAQELELYGEMHRFIPILAHQNGARCVEVLTHHRPRQFGTTKYGIGRTLRVVLDLMTVKFMLKYFASPMKLFGTIGLLCGLVSVLAGVTTLAMKFTNGLDMTGNPLLLLTVLSTMLGVQFTSLGFLGEVNARIYFSHGKNQNYTVRERLNFSPDESVPIIRRAA